VLQPPLTVAGVPA